MMSSFKRTAGLFFLLSFLLVPQFASAIGLEAAIGGWKQDPSGDISYKGVLPADTLNVENELKYDSKTKVFGWVKIDMPLLIPNIYIMVSPMKFEGTGSKDASFTFGDKTFNVAFPFTSSVQFDHYDIALYYGLPFLKTATLGKLNAEVGLNARIIDFKAEIRQSTTGITESKSMTLPVPMIYLGAQFKPVDRLSLEVELRGIEFDSNHFYDLIGRVKLKVVSPFFISAGYRYEDIKIDKNNIIANLTFSGPFAEAGVEF